jgi:hypothetical protein
VGREAKELRKFGSDVFVERTGDKKMGFILYPVLTKSADSVFPLYFAVATRFHIQGVAR